jgi:NADH:ubiquinone oxidoreductase subunit H
MIVVFFYFLSAKFSLNFLQVRCKILLFFFPVMLVFLFSILAETKRSPFDFAEGERELVSGFKTEYSSLVFALLFLGEYGKIIFLRFLTSVIFFFRKFFFLAITGKLIVLGFF